jgi:hypothetical protein
MAQSIWRPLFFVSTLIGVLFGLVGRFTGDGIGAIEPFTKIEVSASLRTKRLPRAFYGL